MEEEHKEIENFDTHKIISMVMDGVGEGYIESHKAIEAVKYLMKLDSKAENFIAKPEVQTFIDNANAYAKSNGCHIIELRGFSIANDDGSSATRADISAVAKIYRCLPVDFRFKGFDRAASSLLVVD